MMKRRPLPKFRIGLDLPVPPGEVMREILPFRRSWIAIAIIAVMDAVFIFPAVTTFAQASEGWGKLDSLMDLVTAVFLSAWLLGWSLGPLALTLVLLLMLFGREVVRARRGLIEIGIGLPGLALFIDYDPARIRNLRLATPADKSGKSWRGRYLAFDYGSRQIDFGSAMDEAALTLLKARMQSAAGTVFRSGEASEAELAEEQAQRERPAVQEKDVGPLQISEPTRHEAPVTLASPSTLILIAANLIPVFGSLFLGWRLADVMVLYWAESAVVGFFNICKMAVIGRWLVLFTGLFFLGHFGGFMAVHFLFLYSLFIEGVHASGPGADLAEVAQLFIGLWPALLALFVSHAMSFFINFIGRGEYRGKTIKQQMREPYSRIVFMHLVLIFGGFLVMLIGEATPVLLLIIVLKIAIDVRAHLKQRQTETAL